MLRLSKLTDYGVVVLSHMARRPGRLLCAGEVAEMTLLPEPTVAKILKLLARENIVQSLRGAQGGYILERDLSEISVAALVTALDGPVALTACVDGQEGACSVESLCPMRGGWDRVNAAVRAALESVTLAEVAGPIRPLPEAPAVAAGRLEAASRI